MLNILSFKQFKTTKDTLGVCWFLDCNNPEYFVHTDEGTEKRRIHENVCKNCYWYSMKMNSKQKAERIWKTSVLPKAIGYLNTIRGLC